MDKNEIGKIIKQRREILRITQKDLSAISGVTLRKLIDIENGLANPTFQTLKKLLDALGLSIYIKVKS
ncbi:MAG: helix-turn-helix domain-containing protein [Bacteroidota bacterium]|jgi:transcriptional regulator with XRE-family HTH domain